MRTTSSILFVLGLAACKPDAPAASVTPPPAQPPAAASQPVKTGTSAATGNEWGEGVVKRGEPLSATPPTELASVLKTPADFAGKTVKTEGVVAKACSKKGCWMELQTAAGEGGMRVSFKDYAFFVPLDAAGSKAVIEGTVEVKTLSKEDAAHLEGEGAKIGRNAKGEPQELAFVASGVELTRAN